jgi:hypothetical protein
MSPDNYASQIAVIWTASRHKYGAGTNRPTGAWHARALVVADPRSPVQRFKRKRPRDIHFTN